MKKDCFTKIRDAQLKCILSHAWLTLNYNEQLLGFRGICKFKLYIPNKPSKYGIQILMICDTKTKYMVDTMPYLGKGTALHNNPQAQYFVRELATVSYTHLDVYKRQEKCLPMVSKLYERS